METRLTDKLGPFATPPTVRMVRADSVPPGYWVRHWHFPLPVTPLYADFEFGAHLPLADVVSREEHAAIDKLFPMRHVRAHSFLVVDGFAYSSPNSPEIRNPHPADLSLSASLTRDGLEWLYLRRWEQAWRPLIVDDLRRFRAADLRTLTDQALLEHIRELSLFLIECWAAMHLNSPSVKLIRLRLHTFCDAYFSLSEGEFLDLLAGHSPTTSGPVQIMEELAAAARWSPELVAALAGPDPWLSPPVQALLAPFVEQYGHRATDWEYVTPTLAERPQRVVDLLVEAMKRLDSGTGNAAEAVRRKRMQKVAALRAKLPDEDARRRFDTLLSDAQETYAIHEDDINLYHHGEGRMRYALLAAGDRLAARGLLTERERVFFLRRPELERALESALAGAPDEELRQRADERWRAYQEQLKLDPPHSFGEPPPHVAKARAARPAAATAARAPQPTNGTATPAAGPVPAAADELGTLSEIRGVGASPGSYTGPARVILTEDQFEQVSPGDVLVSPQTTPSWTILFGRIGALVTDEGGILSHSAVASREFGIPAVVSTEIGTKALVTGQLVRVDGTDGTVSIVPQ